MVKIAFCDDELTVLYEIRELLDQYRMEYHQEMECSFYNSSLDLLAEIERGVCPDILVLDVIMPGENGISVAKEIRQHDNAVKIILEFPQTVK